MKNLLAIKIVAVVALLSFAGNSFAGIGDLVNNATVQMENAKTINAYDKTFFMGGGMRMKFPMMSISPINITAPSIKTGCGGVDIGFGGIGFLNMDYYGKLVQSLLPAAPTFALSLALSTVCPKCEELFAKLQNLASQINGLNFNSCQAIAMASNLGSKLGIQLNKDLGGGTSGSWMDAVSNATTSATNYVGKVSQTLSGAAKWMMTQAGPTGSLLKYSANKSGLTFTDIDVSILRCYFGDVIINNPDPNSKDAPTPFIPIEPCNDSKNKIRTLVDALTDGYYIGDGKDENGQTITQPSYSIGTPLSIATVDNIISDLKNRVALAPNELQVLAFTPAPVVTYLDFFSVDPVVLDALAPALKDYIAYAFAYQLLASISNIFSKSLAEMSLDVVGSDAWRLATIKDNRDAILVFAAQEAKDYTKTLNEKITAVNAYRTVEAKMTSDLSNNPVFGAYNFSKGVLR